MKKYLATYARTWCISEKWVFRDESLRHRLLLGPAPGIDQSDEGYTRK